MVAFAELPKGEQGAIKKAFEVLATQNGPDPVVSEVALPHLCRVMNLCVNEEDLYQICISLGRGSSEGGRTPHTSAAPHILPPTEFTFDAIRRVYDTYAPKQSEHVRMYFQLFNLLDVNEIGRISQADLRHCMCSTGDRLTDDEFHHLLYANDLLHKPEITVFEFVRLLLRVPVAHCRPEPIVPAPVAPATTPTIVN
ncbi:Hypothetical protein, putative [Bodo saltans]|uniref:Calmodulin n=1 Tax=Bodo saltans TaxID=75058 RepID=A0A0S4KH26_BODSA|nr:Hypothetical protein, putative [Bodo saltans]|eukprot:CUI11038.1 Hypothetical protein, putative [Bodo saltans]